MFHGRQYGLQVSDDLYYLVARQRFGAVQQVHRLVLESFHVARCVFDKIDEIADAREWRARVQRAVGRSVFHDCVPAALGRQLGVNGRRRRRPTPSLTLVVDRTRETGWRALIAVFVFSCFSTVATIVRYLLFAAEVRHDHAVWTFGFSLVLVVSVDGNSDSHVRLACTGDTHSAGAG